MSNAVGTVTIRGSTNEELERQMAQFDVELRREFAKYHQREYRDHRAVGWFIRWLMSDDQSIGDNSPTIKHNRHASACH